MQLANCAFVMQVLKADFNFWSWNFLCSQNGLIAVSPFSLQVDDFLQALINYDKEHIPENCLKVVNEQYLKDPEFNPNLIRTKSFAAAGLCAWVINIIRFYEVAISPILLFSTVHQGLWRSISKIVSSFLTIASLYSMYCDRIKSPLPSLPSPLSLTTY